jgi:hypothetical protein
MTLAPLSTLRLQSSSQEEKDMNSKRLSPPEVKGKDSSSRLDEKSPVSETVLMLPRASLTSFNTIRSLCVAPCPSPASPPHPPISAGYGRLK